MRKRWQTIVIISLFLGLLVVQNAMAALPFNIQSESALLLETTTGEILVDKNSKKPLLPASITKMMVMLLVMEAVEKGQIKLEDKVIASPEACRMAVPRSGWSRGKK